MDRSIISNPPRGLPVRPAGGSVLAETVLEYRSNRGGGFHRVVAFDRDPDLRTLTGPKHDQLGYTARIRLLLIDP